MAKVIGRYDKHKKYYPLTEINKKYGVRPGIVQEDQHFADNHFIWRTKPKFTGKQLDIIEVVDMMVTNEYDTICDNLYSTSYQDLHNISEEKMKSTLKALLIPGLFNILYMVFAFRIQYKFFFKKWCAFLYYEQGFDYDKKERVL